MNKAPALVILAAGMGSRYGGMKQIDGVGSHGEPIIEFSIYDAWQAGFRQGYVFEKVNGQSVNFEAFNNFRWVKGLTYDFTMRLPIGVCTNVVALWPLQYNKPQGQK